jgi:hypothetical protein
MRSFIQLAGAAMAAASPVLVLPSPNSGTAPDPTLIQISAVSASGNGCPQGTFTANLSPDRQVCPSHENVSSPC